VKLFISFLRYIFVVLLLMPVCSYAKAQDASYIDMDSVQISLLTCQPHEEVYSLYGHTAIRYYDKTRNMDLAINYGMFSFKKPFFILRFVFGLTDYEMGIEPFDAFCAQYAGYGSGVYEQVLHLTREEKSRIANAINENYKPENRVYRYNYFYDNCTTRARDMLLDHLTRRLDVRIKDLKWESYRDLVHQCCRRTPWVKFGNDMLLGLQADFPIDYKQKQFLPENLKEDFEHIFLNTGKGKTEKLVSRSGWVVLPGVQTEMADFPLSPIACMLLLAGIIVLVTLLEGIRKTRFRWVDAAILLVCGLVGLILFAMIFSQHPTVRLNLQILLFCPFTLLYIYSSVKKSREKQFYKGMKVWCALLILFLIGGLFQHYAEGIRFLALSLLLRYTYFIYRNRKI
jgi:hypothetical protein